MLYSTVGATDLPTAEEEREQQRREAVELFCLTTGKSADYTSVTNCLSYDNANGLDSVKVVSALDVVRFSKWNDDETQKVLLKCYERNPYWLIRVKCVGTLLSFHNLQAENYANSLLQDAALPLEAKLHISMDLISVGNLQGYPILLAGMASSNSLERILATELKRHFAKYNGHVYDVNSGKKVDVATLGNQDEPPPTSQ